MPSALLVSPHPDDEVLGLGGTVGTLVAAGWTVTNFACSLGRAADHERRHDELRRAGDRFGIDVEVLGVGISGSDDLDAAQIALVAGISEAVVRLQPDVVVSPTPHDLHHGHEVVGRSVAAALAHVDGARWWQYAIWGDLPFANLYIPVEPRYTERALYVLGAYSGEIARNDYRDLLSGNWIRNRALGAERVFGFGAMRPVEARAVELAYEVVRSEGSWFAGTPRVLDFDAPLVDPTRRVVDAWVTSAGPSGFRGEA